LLALAGALLAVAPHIPMSTASLAGIGAVFVPVAYLIFAAHSYRALSDRNLNRTLSPHWFTLALVLFLLGSGFLGGLAVPPQVSRWTHGTHLTDLQTMLASLAVVAMSLGVINQASAEQRGENRRVTGFIPFWLVAFGVIGGGLALAGAGLVQVYLERVLSIGAQETQTLIAPLVAGWMAGYVLALLGAVTYALGFYARRPRVGQSTHPE
jgi:nitric oxide reductase large subunit